MYKDHSNWEIVAFEPLPECIGVLKNRSGLGNFEIIEAAASIENGVFDFTIGKNTRAGTLRNDKTTFMTKNKMYEYLKVNKGRYMPFK